MSTCIFPGTVGSEQAVHLLGATEPTVCLLSYPGKDEGEVGNIGAGWRGQQAALCLGPDVSLTSTTEGQCPRPRFLS